MTASAFQFAQYFLHLAQQESEPAPLTHMHVQKLLYYVQGWSLALRNEPAFVEEIQAWTYGPVAPLVYARFAEWGQKPIDTISLTEAEALDDREKFLATAVWDRYKDFSSLALSRQTHLESPWRAARGDLPASAKSCAAISHESLRAYFHAQAQECRGPVDLDARWSLLEDPQLRSATMGIFIRNAELLRRLAS